MLKPLVARVNILLERIGHVTIDCVVAEMCALNMALELVPLELPIPLIMDSTNVRETYLDIRSESTKATQSKVYFAPKLRS